MRIAPVRRALDFGVRPDPARGIFETILVSGGTAPLLEAQLERLTASAHELYGADLTPELAWHPPVAGDEGLERLRVSYVPGSPVGFERGPRPPDPAYAEIAPFVLPGGLGRHKWLDRDLLDGIAAAVGDEALALLLDSDGAVLESARMNVLIEERGRLISPPSDGRFRPGFGRSRLRYEEEPVDLDRLCAADAVVLTSALRVLRLPLVP